MSYICTPHFADDLIKNVLKNPQFNLEEVDTDMLQRLSRSIDSDSGDLNIISMQKEGDGGQNPELFSISGSPADSIFNSQFNRPRALRIQTLGHAWLLDACAQRLCAAAHSAHLRYRSHTFHIP